MDGLNLQLYSVLCGKTKFSPHNYDISVKRQQMLPSVMNISEAGNLKLLGGIFEGDTQSTTESSHWVCKSN